MRVSAIKSAGGLPHLVQSKTMPVSNMHACIPTLTIMNSHEYPCIHNLTEIHAHQPTNLRQPSNQPSYLLVHPSTLRPSICTYIHACKNEASDLRQISHAAEPTGLCGRSDCSTENRSRAPWLHKSRHKDCEIKQADSDQQKQSSGI